MSPYKRDIQAFVDACEMLLAFDTGIVILTQPEIRTIQYYLAALSAKFPAVLL